MFSTELWSDCRKSALLGTRLEFSVPTGLDDPEEFNEFTDALRREADFDAAIILC